AGLAVYHVMRPKPGPDPEPAPVPSPDPPAPSDPFPLAESTKQFSRFEPVSIKISGAANIELKKDPSSNADRWAFVSPWDGQTADGKTIADLLRVLGNTELAGQLVDEAPSPVKLTEYGLAPASPRMKVTIGLKNSAGPTGQERVYLF